MVGSLSSRRSGSPGGKRWCVEEPVTARRATLRRQTVSGLTGRRWRRRVAGACGASRVGRGRSRPAARTSRAWAEDLPLESSSPPQSPRDARAEVSKVDGMFGLLCGLASWWRARRPRPRRPQVVCARRFTALGCSYRLRTPGLPGDGSYARRSAAGAAFGVEASGSLTPSRVLFGARSEGGPGALGNRRSLLGATLSSVSILPFREGEVSYWSPVRPGRNGGGAFSGGAARAPRSPRRPFRHTTFVSHERLT